MKNGKNRIRCAKCFLYGDMLKRLCVLMFVFHCFSFTISAQDIHFSSIGFSPMFFNPARVAFMNDRFRLSTIYRNQWQTISKGYNTFFASAEVLAYSNADASQNIGFGIGFTSDVAGSLRYGERDVSVSASYFFSLNKKNSTYLSVGIQAEQRNFSYDLSNAIFNREETYNDEIRFDELNTYDISLATSFRSAKDDEHLLQVGISLFNINRPKMSYFSDGERLPRRLLADISYMFPITENEKFSLNPTIYYQHQHSFNEMIFGSELLIDLDQSIFIRKILSIGLFMRNFEAIIITPRFRYGGFVGGVGYDANISRLSKVSKTYGAFEIWLTYSFNTCYGKHQLTKIPCPVF